MSSYKQDIQSLKTAQKVLESTITKLKSKQSRTTTEARLKDKSFSFSSAKRIEGEVSCEYDEVCTERHD